MLCCCMCFVTISLFCAVSNICIIKNWCCIKNNIFCSTSNVFVNNAYDFNSFNYF